jgi:hypothetical protein
MRLRRQAAAAGGGRWPLPACLPACCWLARRLAASPAALCLCLQQQLRRGGPSASAAAIRLCLCS